MTVAVEDAIDINILGLYVDNDIGLQCSDVSADIVVEPLILMLWLKKITIEEKKLRLDFEFELKLIGHVFEVSTQYTMCCSQL